MTRRTVRPTIEGPSEWRADGPPPPFRVDTAGLPLYMVELAAARCLMASVVHRTADNYFCGGDVASVFATGARWLVPAAVWARLAHLPVVYYRVIAVDQSAGVSELSVDDEDLGALPTLHVLGPEGT